jgi:hypothetical protein
MMAYTDPSSRTESEVRGTAADDLRVRDRGPREEWGRPHTTETRRSFMTSEMWVMVVAVAGVLIAGYITDAELAAERAWTLATVIVTGYIVSRGFAKSGSREHLD